MSPVSTFSLTNQAYDLIKKVVTIVSPAAITLYITLAQIWEWVGYEKVVLTMAAVTTFLGVFIGVSSKRYNQEVTDLFSPNDVS